VHLSSLFKENGLQLADILIRQYDYPPTFQSLTEQKKIQDQSVLTNRALAKQAEVDTRLRQTAAQGQNLINIKTAEFQAQITGINAQRDLYERSRHAEADLLVRKAEAQGTELINRAMEGAGSDKLLRFLLDAGELGQRQIFSGIRGSYAEPEKLVGRSVVFIANLAPRKMRFGLSEGMILSAGFDGGALALLDADAGALPGMPVR
jgi:methionine--tRNA ligase beta chain